MTLTSADRKKMAPVVGALKKFDLRELQSVAMAILVMSGVGQPAQDIEDMDEWSLRELLLAAVEKLPPNRPQLTKVLYLVSYVANQVAV